MTKNQRPPSQSSKPQVATSQVLGQLSKPQVLGHGPMPQVLGHGPKPQVPTSRSPKPQVPTSQVPTSQAPKSQASTSQAPTAQRPSHRQPVLASKLNQLLLLITALLLVWSAINPHDYLTWLLEVFPALIGFFLLWFFRKSFSPTPLLFWLICVHSWVLILGAHYTYAEVPLGKWFAEAFDLKRNHYDRLGHFMQGFEPAILARELLLKKDVLKKPDWLGFLCVTICLSFSALYELFEWSVAIILNQTAEAFLGTQGDIWDTQSDMFLALIGAVSAVVLLKSLHDKMLKRQQEL